MLEACELDKFVQLRGKPKVMEKLSFYQTAATERQKRPNSLPIL
jgi:hypothetical protein